MRKLTETAADDLLAFVRRVRRYAVEAQTHGGHEGALDTLGEDARHLLDKHGLLTMADDPEVARVFMQDGESRERADWFTARDYETARMQAIAARSPARFADGPHPISCGSPARMSYVESPRCGQCGECATVCECRWSVADSFTEGERVTLVCVGGLATDPDLDPGTPAEGQRIAHGSRGVVDCAGTHNVGVVFDGYEGSVRVPVSMLRRG